MANIKDCGNHCGKVATAHPNIHTYDVASFGPDVRSANFDFARLEHRLHVPLEMPHRHEFYQIVWVTEGHGLHIIDSDIYPVRDGVLFCMAPGRVHSWDLSEPGRQATGYVFNFSAEFASRCVKDESGIVWSSRLADRSDASAMYLTARQSFTLQEIVKQLEQEYEGDEFGRSKALQAHFELFLIQLERYRPASEPVRSLSSGAVLTEKFRRLIDEHLKRRRSVHEYALLLNVSESHLCHTVRKHTGMTASQLVQERVLLEAKRLLVHREVNISDIGNLLGFDDPAYFSRLFKKHTGQSPKAFKLAFQKALAVRARTSQ